MSKFVFRKESEALARDCHGNLVKTVLFNVNNIGLGIPEIIKEIDKQMNLKNFPTPIIEEVVKGLCDEKEELREESGKYFLKNEEYETIGKTINNRQDTLKHIESIMKTRVQNNLKKTKVGSNTLDTAIKVFYDFLITWFSSESDFVANLLFSKKKFVAPNFPTQILSEALEKIRNNDLKQAIRSSIVEIFEAPGEILIRFLYEILQNYLHLELLNIDPECRILQRDAFSKKTLILDTNVLMATFLKANSLHEGTNEIISLAQNLGVNLVLTKRTKQEWLWSLERANEEYQTIRNTRPDLLQKLDDIFIRSFFKENEINPSLAWHEFYLQMRQIDVFAKNKGIRYWYKKELYLEKLPNKEFFTPLSGRVYYCGKIRGNPKSKKVSEHDAYHLLLVRAKREEEPKDMLGPSCWFLTHDNSLVCADEGLNEFLKTPFDPPSSFLADMWIAVIGSFVGPEISERTLAETFGHLMKTHFATMPSGLNATRMVGVLGHWLTSKSLSDTDIEKILGDALVIKYYDALREAQINDPSKVKELEEKLRQEVDQQVYGFFDERVASAQKERDAAKKLSLEREQELLAERRERKLILRLCAILGIVFAATGLIFFATGNVTAGGALTLSGIAFIVLALAFRHIKMKLGPIEIEATQ